MHGWKKMNVTILGGGPAGISAAYFAAKKGFAFKVYEQTDCLGGNCSTREQDSFLWDSGAHRIHDEDPFLISELRKLLGTGLIRVTRPSKIYFKGRFIHFPLRLTDLFTKVDPLTLVRAIADVCINHLKDQSMKEDFRSTVRTRYGDTLSELFLMNYSRKLWGIPLSKLSGEIAGKRLRGLSAGDLVKAILTRAKTSHEGDFYYHPRGIGAVMNAMISACGPENFQKCSNITEIVHDKYRIRKIVVNGKESDVEHLVSTIPIDAFIRTLTPSPPEIIREISGKFVFRSLTLLIFFLNREQVSKAATLYFPAKKFPFTRIYEPKNRSLLMSPAGKTSLVVEIPHDMDRLGQIRRNILSITDSVKTILTGIGLFSSHELLGSTFQQISRAYPVIDIHTADYVKKVMDYVSTFSNLDLTGRNSLFKYISLHEVMSDGHRIMAGL